MSYFVYIKDKDAEVHSTVCKDKSELNKLMMNMKKDLEIVSVNRLEDDFRNDFSEFCEFNERIETGVKE